MVKPVADIEEKDCLKKRVEIKTIAIKPLLNTGDYYYYSDVLKYLLKVIDQDDPIFEFIISLTSFALGGNLSNKQSAKIREIINFYKNKGILDE